MDTLTTTPHTNAISEITSLHDQIVAAARTSLDSAIRIGELPAGIKKTLRHGDWGTWVKQNLPFTIRTATNYLRVFSGRDRLKSETVSDLTAAYRVLSPPAETPKPKTQKELITTAAILMQEAQNILETEEVSPERAKSIVGELDKIEKFVKGWLSEPCDLPFPSLIFIITLCHESRQIIKYKTALGKKGVLQ